MYCSNCGNKLTRGSKFCEHCGTPLNNVEYDNYQHPDESFNNDKQLKNNDFPTKNPWELYLDTWKNIFNYKGVTSRRGFWWAFLFHDISLALVSGILSRSTLLIFILRVIIFLPILSSGVRRMRDVNKPIFIPYVLIIGSLVFNENMFYSYILLIPRIILFITMVIFIVFACFETKNYNNRDRIN
ncbi:DUF805 domain-containing protein [Staphylococcus pasteuri]|uniref:Uncharacterized membrane protein YhaH, DUF805 family n=3 Tax=Staphylococcus TaxID=1279 RepID=A0ABY1H442_9STAP|nr:MULTISPECIES: DUF805 domain-containing protein [Staphylococcus]ATH63601.1 hypothetical protein BJG87_11785 [Staphylococcus pasteuri]KKI55791.1 hypothetical protein UF70_2230 [Staphylococcus pasteuri]MCF7599590.1 DUF805 domain-containing protein [Staphylococcus pasteuri]MDO6573684.1 DUF805 domain-containing protein [Staphylococcus pasteuri_A]MEB6209193.1 DUF805 domain-containing protein [Staphylococcus pasteuri]